MESNGFPQAIHCSQSTRDIVAKAQEQGHSNAEFNFHSVGKRQVKGKGEMETFLLEYGDYTDALRQMKEQRAAAAAAEAKAEADAEAALLSPTPAGRAIDAAETARIHELEAQVQSMAQVAQAQEAQVQSLTQAAQTQELVAPAAPAGIVMNEEGTKELADVLARMMKEQLVRACSDQVKHASLTRCTSAAVQFRHVVEYIALLLHSATHTAAAR
jgi:hypothetical protein